MCLFLSWFKGNAEVPRKFPRSSPEVPRTSPELTWTRAELNKVTEPNLRFPATFCENLRFSAKICGFLRFPAPSTCWNFQEKGWICENLRFSAKICVLGALCHLSSVTFSLPWWTSPEVRVLFRRRELTEPHWVLGQTRWVLRKNSVSSRLHRNNRPKATHWARSPELSEPRKTHWARCLKLYSPKPYSARFWLKKSRGAPPPWRP